MRRGIRNVTLRYLKFVEKPSGLVLRYLRYPGAKLIRLPGGDMASPEFLAAYAAALAHANNQAKATAYNPATVAGAISDYLRSDAFKALSEATRRAHRRHLTSVQAKGHTAMLHDLAERHIAADVRSLGGHPGLNRLKAWRAFTKWATRQGRLVADPARNVMRPDLPKSEGFPRWTADEVAAFRARWQIGTTQRAIFELLHWTGARISDAVRLGPGMVRKEGVLSFRQQKTGEVANVPWTCTLPGYVDAADRDMMLAAIAHLSGQMTFLATRHDRTRSGKSIGGDVSAAAKLAGVRKTAHGLRKTRATVLAEGGATASQIAAWTGHKTLAEVEHYTREYDRMKAVMG